MKFTMCANRRKDAVTLNICIVSSHYFNTILRKYRITVLIHIVEFIGCLKFCFTISILC